MNQTSTKSNRLGQEKSPYLLQHANNPVDWYPWGEEAFATASEENKPVFLSIGYSTCHWCHVMERESFADEEVASFINRHFIPIKVDREERPDVDHIYMSACQALTGRGGWPLTALLTPDKKPFFAGTYFPKRGRYGQVGLLDLLEVVTQRWQQDADQLREAAQDISRALDRKGKTGRIGELNEEALHAAYRYFESQYDEQYGGFGPAPKFPMPHYLSFLVRYAYSTPKQQALTMVEKTLQSMHQGGLYDHLGFGFSRYSTDDRWLVPHFEKMLYDNALLLTAYVECFQITDDPLYSRIAREIATYVLRDMTGQHGGFYAAEDADSEGVEGKFYVWRPEEVYALLGDEMGQLFCQWYDVSEQGNFEHGLNILNRIDGDKRKIDLPYDREHWEERLRLARHLLWQAREERVHPYKDDKVLTFWNGLMIAALARAGRALGENAYLNAARQAMTFLWSNLREVNGRWHVRYREGEVGPAAFLDDYAAVIAALLELYQADYNPDHLAKAAALQELQDELFWDQEEGAYFFSSHDAEQLLMRPKQVYDGATPSGNSMAALNLIRLSHLTGRSEWVERYDRLLAAFAPTVNAFPAGSTVLIQSLFNRGGENQQVVIVSGDDWLEVVEQVESVARRFLPQTSFILAHAEFRQQLGELAPFTQPMQAVGGRTTFYVCQDFACEAPITSADAFMALMDARVVKE